MTITDFERLNFLEAITVGYGKGWILRPSTTGRGWRLHETNQEGAYPTPREAIDAVIDQEYPLIPAQDWMEN